MKYCPYCSFANPEGATVCRKCDAPFGAAAATVYSGRRRIVGPIHAKYVRDRGLAALILGLLIKVYWGGYGPWKPIDNPTLIHLRGWLEPTLLIGGIALYLLGWLLNWI